MPEPTQTSTQTSTQLDNAEALVQLLTGPLADIPALHDERMTTWTLGRFATPLEVSVAPMHPEPFDLLRQVAERLGGGEIKAGSKVTLYDRSEHQQHHLTTTWNGRCLTVRVCAPAHSVEAELRRRVAELEAQLLDGGTAHA